MQLPAEEGCSAGKGTGEPSAKHVSDVKAVISIAAKNPWSLSG
jgi:hypothetical protein